MDNYYQSLTAAYRASLDKMNTDLAAAFMPISESIAGMQNNIVSAAASQFSLATQMQAIQEALTASVRQMQEMLSTALISGVRDSLVINDSFARQMESIQKSVNAFALPFHGIAIHENYVSMPESLIPDDFQYEEIPDNSAALTKHCINKSSDAKRLSLSDALSVINMVVFILLTLLAPFYNHAVDCTLSPKIDTKAGVPMTKEQAQQLLGYLSELNTYQQSIIAALGVPGKSSQEPDSYPGDIQHRFATPGSANTYYNEFPSTSDNDQ